MFFHASCLASCDLENKTLQCFPLTEKSLLKRCYSAGAQSRPRRGSRTESLKSLSRESLSEDSTLPDPTPHMRKSVVSTVDTNSPKPKLTKQRKSSASEVSYANKGLARRKSHVPQKRGNVALKMTYSKDLHTLEVHLINATELPIRHGRMLDVFARLSLKTPSKRERFQSKVHKKTCNPIFDERFAFKSHRFSELKKARLKIKLFDRLGVSRYEPIGETVISLCDENVMRGDNMTRDLLAGKPQVSCVRNAC